VIEGLHKKVDQIRSKRLYGRKEVSFSSNNDDPESHLLNRSNLMKDRQRPELAFSGPSFFTTNPARKLQGYAGRS
jgi:hypothetical protein